MKSIMITLVGGRITTILATLKQYQHLEKLYCIVSRDSSRNFKTLKTIIQREFPRLTICDAKDGNFVNAFSKSEVQTKIDSILELEEKSIDNIVIQLTSGTQVMCIAAYDAAQKYNIPAIFVNTAGGQIIDLLNNSNEPITSRVDVKFYASIYNFTQINTDDCISAEKGFPLEKEKALLIADFFGKKYLDHKKFSKWIRKRRDKSKLNQSINLGNSLPTESFSGVLNKLNNNRLISLSKNTDTQEIIVNNISFEFVVAKWLEVYAYKCCLDTGFFDDCQLSVNLNQEYDCDVFCIKTGIPLIIECKTGEQVVISDAQSLEEKARRLGGNYCMTMIVYTGKLSRGLQDREKNFRVQFLHIKELVDDPEKIREVFTKQRSVLN